MRCARWDISRTLALTLPSLTLARHDSRVASAGHGRHRANRLCNVRSTRHSSFSKPPNEKVE